MSDHLDIIAADGWEGAVHRLTDVFSSPEAPQWDILDLRNLPEASLTYQILPGIAESFGLQVRVNQEDTARSSACRCAMTSICRSRTTRNSAMRSAASSGGPSASGGRLYIVDERHVLEAGDR